MIPNGYTKLHDVTVKVEAQDLETIAGYPDGKRRESELRHTMRNGDTRDVSHLRWMVALAAEQIEAIEAGAYVDAKA